MPKKETKKAAAPIASPRPGETSEQRANRLELELAQLKTAKKFSTEQVIASPQPSPSDVRPGKVWVPGTTVDPITKEVTGGMFVDHLSVPTYTFEVRSPVKSYNGTKAGVQFREGVGGTDDAELALWFVQTLKYEVTPDPLPKEDAAEDVESAEKADAGSDAELDAELGERR